MKVCLAKNVLADFMISSSSLKINEKILQLIFWSEILRTILFKFTVKILSTTKFLKTGTPKIIIVIILNIIKVWFFNAIICLTDADEIANSV